MSRLWNANWGGYVLFDWDTYFAAFMYALFDEDLAYANAVEVTKGWTRRGFVPIAGLHHAGRAHAAGFCVFNDIGVVIDTLRSQFGVKRIAYVDIDVHHGDGLYYPYEEDPDLIYADIHQDGRTLYLTAQRGLYRIRLEVPGLGRVTGDVAWGGNWFFLTELPGLHLVIYGVLMILVMIYYPDGLAGAYRWLVAKINSWRSHPEPKAP